MEKEKLQKYLDGVFNLCESKEQVTRIFNIISGMVTEAAKKRVETLKNSFPQELYTFFEDCDGEVDINMREYDTGNYVIKEKAKMCGVKLWEIAERLNITPETFSRRLRNKIDFDEMQRIICTISEIAEERSHRYIPKSIMEAASDCDSNF